MVEIYPLVSKVYVLSHRIVNIIARFRKERLANFCKVPIGSSIVYTQSSWVISKDPP